MRNQSVNKSGRNVIEIDSSNIDSFDENIDYLFRLTKEGCKTTQYETDVEVCSCTVYFTFFVNCLDLGVYNLYVVDNTNREKILHNTTVTVY